MGWFELFCFLRECMWSYFGAGLWTFVFGFLGSYRELFGFEICVGFGRGFCPDYLIMVDWFAGCSGLCCVICFEFIVLFIG